MTTFNKGSGLLSYSIRLPVVLKHMGPLLLITVLLTATSLLVSFIFGEYTISARYAAVISALLFLAVTLSRIHAPQDLQLNEAFVITALIFIIPPLFISYAFMGSGLTFSDALFEAVSGITTTGLSTLQDIEGRPSTFLFTRAWMQWYGGLGVVIFYVIFLIFTGEGAKRLTHIHINEDDLAGSARSHAKKVLMVYGFLTLTGVLFLWLFSQDLFNSIVISLAAISTGGFAPYNSSLAHYNLPFQTIAILLACLGSLPFFLYYRWKSERTGGFLLDPSIKRIIILGLLGSSVIFSFMLMNGYGWVDALKHAPITALSAQTTAGFSSIDPSELDNGSKLTLIFMMFIGGNTDSTSGGLKIYRFFLIIHLIGLLFVKISSARHAVLDLSMDGAEVTDDEIKKIMAIFALFIGIIFFSWLPFVAYGFSPLDSLFEVVSAIGTVGLSTGLSSSGLPISLKLILCADMLLGRLEIIPVMLLFHPRTWIGRRMK